MNTERSLTGIIDITRRGTGFLSHDDFTEDILIERQDLGMALNGDEVTVQVLPSKKKGRVAGKVTAINKRATTEFVGILKKEQGSFMLIPDDRRCYVEFKIATPSTDAAEGDKVVVKITRWNSALVPPIAEIIQILGPAGNHETETKATIISHGFATEFPPEVVAEALELQKERAISAAEIARRRDFRNIVTFTIDPDDAKDFDDALSVEIRPDGLFEIGVHIADVTHYVRPGMALDEEAIKRGTSVYLVDRTIPMLPEELSNDICSLKPNEDRLTFSAVFVMDEHAHIKERWFGRTVIHSNTRFTYATAQHVLDSGVGPHTQELAVLKKLANIMRKERDDKGAISFETEEVKIEIAPDGKPIRVYVKERLETMKIIEDWMLLANKEVPSHVASLAKERTVAALPFIYRIHDTPDQDRIEDLRIFLKAVGYELGKKGARVTSEDIGTLLSHARGTPEAATIQMATLRSMAKAVYSHKNIGHFSLAFERYSHFTSPIRRYPDMVAHRLLALHLENKPVSPGDALHYQRIAVSSSEREVSAVEAERDSIKYKQVEFISAHVGKTFQGIVTGVSENGVYVMEKETHAEGLLRVSSLSDDYYVLDKKQYALVGERTKRAFRLGDTFSVILFSANRDEQQIEWKLA